MLFILIYFIVAAFPIVGIAPEIYPFFSFKLYSRIIDKYDVVDFVVDGEPVIYFSKSNRRLASFIEAKGLRAITSAHQDDAEWCTSSAVSYVCRNFSPLGEQIKVVRLNGKFAPDTYSSTSSAVSVVATCQCKR